MMAARYLEDDARYARRQQQQRGVSRERQYYNNNSPPSSKPSPVNISGRFPDVGDKPVFSNDGNVYSPPMDMMDELKQRIGRKPCKFLTVVHVFDLVWYGRVDQSKENNQSSFLMTHSGF